MILHGDSREKLRELEGESIESVITDPPAGISFMGKGWDGDKGGRDKWIAWLRSIMEECLRVLKPGGHIAVWAIPRTSHWTRMAIDDAGFEIRHIVDHVYATGFPKSQNVGKAYDKKFGNEREVTKEENKPDMSGDNYGQGKRNYTSCKYKHTKDTSEWEGYGTALKPAHEDWVIARKPLSEKSIVDNCIKHGTGAINIDGCRIPTGDTIHPQKAKRTNGGEAYGDYKLDAMYTPSEQGRFPADVVVSGDALNDGEMTKSGKMKEGQKRNSNDHIRETIGDPGSKSRFFDLDKWAEKHGIFYCSKPSKKERNAGCENNNHPTTKPVTLMAWLVTLLAPKKGDTVLDPFMGSGTTGVACEQTDRKFVGIEKEAEYIEIAKARIKYAANEIRQATII